MARSPVNFKIGGPVIVEVAEKTAWLRMTPATAVPARFTARVPVEEPPMLVDLDVRVRVGHQPEVMGLALQTGMTTQQAPITTSLLRRVLVDQLLQAALEEATTRGVEPVLDRAFRTPGDPPGTGWVGDAKPLQGTGHRTPAEMAWRAAEQYKAAQATGDRAPAQTAASQLRVSRSTVARYLREARARGYLPAHGNE